MAREVCAGGPLTADGVSRALNGLVAKSVVARDGARHRMLDTIREYGRMWLAELGEERAAADRHAACFLGLARNAHAGWTGDDQISWYHRIAEAHADLCAALDHLLVHDTAAAQEMAGRIGFFWCCCGHLPQTREYARRALAAGPAEAPTAPAPCGCWASPSCSRATTRPPAGWAGSAAGQRRATAPTRASSPPPICAASPI